MKKGEIIIKREKINCLYCKKEITRRATENKKFCSRECLRKNNKGKNNPNYGKKWTAEQRLKLSNKIKKQYKTGRKNWNVGLTSETSASICSQVKKQKGQKRILNVSTETRRKQREATIKRNLIDNVAKRPEVRKKISDANKGKTPWNKGYGDYIKGDKSPNWRGGISFELYGKDWNKQLKHLIRERDKYTCQICGKNYKELHNVHKRNSIIVHHIDFNKKNCNPNNLTSLCRSCHTKLHWKHNQLNKKSTEKLHRR